MNDRPTVLLLGGTGRTGLCALEQLTDRGVAVRAIVRSAQKVPERLRRRPGVTLIEASLLELSEEQLTEHVRGVDAVISCLGHVLTLRGVFGAPRALVTDAMRRVTAAVRRLEGTGRMRVILMSSVSVNRPRRLDARRGSFERFFLAVLRLVLPPARDNQTAADFLLREVGEQDSRLEWVIVRPDSLIDGEAGPYTVHEGLVDGLFAPGKTTMQSIGRFMAELVTDDATWARWRGQLPVIVDEPAPALASDARPA